MLNWNNIKTGVLNMFKEKQNQPWEHFEAVYSTRTLVATSLTFCWLEHCLAYLFGKSTSEERNQVFGVDAREALLVGADVSHFILLLC